MDLIFRTYTYSGRPAVLVTTDELSPPATGIFMMTVLFAVLIRDEECMKTQRSSTYFVFVYKKTGMDRVG